MGFSVSKKHFQTIVFLAIAITASPAIALAADAPSRVLTVSGQGEAKAAPDEAALSAGVVSNARTAAAALAQNSKAMNAVFATLKHAGVADRNMQTSNFSVQPQYATDRNGNTLLNITGYQVSNTVTVRVEDLAQVGPTLDALVASGANSIGEISFGIKNTKSLMADARAQAVDDATVRAQALAKAAGVTLGPILSISDSGESMPQPRPMFRMAMASVAAAPPPVAGGEESLSAGVTIVWEIR